MSHLPDQDYEVPIRTVEHAEPIDDSFFDVPTFPVGYAREITWIGTDAEIKAERAELLRRQKARAELGGFGFR